MFAKGINFHLLFTLKNDYFKSIKIAIKNLIECGGGGGVHPGEKRGLDLRGCGV